ncbi:hypothetical protein [Coleofasciculus sp. FACHB-501]|uniref:hypothetical protein n=1 Tax=Cyanophyceae TaxID=3028117 RepID=UPI001684C219|nr:hypothetical protein [Coleofasciculus sp. FACHB-501]MBD1837320.1 hypothetical protein [Coleofasciculus sp. FACHB-501]
MDIFYPTGCFLLEQYKTAGSDRTLWMWWMRSHCLDVAMRSRFHSVPLIFVAWRLEIAATQTKPAFAG